MAASLVTLADAAEMLALRDVRTVRALLAQNGLPVIQLGRQLRVRASDVDALVLKAATCEPARAGAAVPPAVTSPTAGGRRAPRGAIMSSPVRPRRRTALGQSRYRECTAKCVRENPDGEPCECPESWREPVVKGLYRDHRTSCGCSQTQQRSSKCSCPFVCDYADANGSKRFRAKTYARAISVFEGRRSAHRSALERKRRRGAPLETITAQTFFENVVLDPDKLKPRSLETYQSTWLTYHADTYGEWALDDLASAAAHLQAHVDGLVDVCLAVRARTGRYNPYFIRNVWTPLRKLLVVARTKRRWEENPAKYIDLPEVPEPRPDEHLKMPRSVTNFLEREGVDCIIDWVSHRGDGDAAQDAATIQLVFELCLRRNEARGLRVGDVDVARRRVWLRFQVDDGGRLQRPKYVKATDPPTQFPIGRNLADSLEGVLAAHPARETPDAFLLFDDDPFKPMQRDRLPNVMLEAQLALEMVDEWGDPLVTPHGLRHSGITHLARKGLDIYKLRDWARHKDIQTTQMYIHLVNDEALREAGEAFDN